KYRSSFRRRQPLLFHRLVHNHTQLLLNPLHLIANKIINIAIHCFFPIHQQPDMLSVCLYMETKRVTTIDPKNKMVTLINTFTVKPENQDALIANLNKATEEVMRGFPGFISANIHKGLEPNKVAN